MYHAKKNYQYFIKFQNNLKSLKKGSKLVLYIGQFDNIPTEIIHKQDNSKIIVEGQKRIYTKINDQQIIIDDGYESIDILYSYPKITNLKIEIDRYCDTGTVEFFNLFKLIQKKVTLSSECKLHFVWNNEWEGQQIVEILKLFKNQASIKRLKFNLYQNYQYITKCIQDSQKLKHLSLVYPASVYHPINSEKEQEFAEAINSLKKLEKLSIYCESEGSFNLVVNCFYKLMKITRDSENTNYGSTQDNEQQQSKAFKLKQLNLNIECLDFIPNYSDLLKFIPFLLRSDPIIKFRMKFPYSLEYHNNYQAYKIFDLLECYPILFEDCTQLQTFTFSTAGNKHYQDQLLQTKNETSIQSSVVNKSKKGILKQSSSNIRSGHPIVDTLKTLSFLEKQKQLKKLTLKFDQEVDLKDLCNILIQLSGSLQHLNIRIRNNMYNKSQLDRFAGNINTLIQLKTLCLDVQFVEHILFKLNPVSLNKLVKYKQGRMVKRCTDYTVQQFFQNDPLKLLTFLTQIKTLFHFNGLFPGFEYCKDYYRYYYDPSTYDYCINMLQQCERIFYQRLLERKILARMILILSVQLQMNKDQILECLLKFYQF